MSRTVQSLVHLALFAVSSATVTETPGVSCVDPNSADDLSRAIDAAMMELHGTSGWFHNLRSSSGYASALSVYSCTPDEERWVYPTREAATGLLARVLRTGVLRVAGVQWAQGGAADYTTDPLNPTGFWPGYMTAIAERLSAQYAQTITIQRVYYANSVLVVDAVADGVEVEMSEPYYYLSGFHLNTPRIESLAFSCVTAGSASSFFTRSDSGITTTDQLFDTIAAGPNRAIGFIGQGNYDAVSSLLPDSTSPLFLTSADDIATNVLSGALVAGYVSEGAPATSANVNVFLTGIISPRVALFRKDAYTCTADEDGSSAELIALIVVAAALLVLLLLLAFVIMRERQSKPLFQPLLHRHDVASKGVTLPGDSRA